MTGPAVGVGVIVGAGWEVGWLVGVTDGKGVCKAMAVVGGVWLALGVDVLVVGGGISDRHAANRNNETRMIASRFIASEFIGFSKKLVAKLMFCSPENLAKKVAKAKKGLKCG